MLTRQFRPMPLSYILFSYRSPARRALAEDIQLLLTRPDLLKPVDAVSVAPDLLDCFACPDDLTTEDRAATVPMIGLPEQQNDRIANSSSPAQKNGPQKRGWSNTLLRLARAIFAAHRGQRRAL